MNFLLCLSAVILVERVSGGIPPDLSELIIEPYTLPARMDMPSGNFNCFVINYSNHGNQESGNYGNELRLLLDQ